MESLSILIAIAIIALLSGVIHSAIGFGFGIVAISLLPWVVDVRESHVIVSTASVFVLVGAIWTYREGWDKQSLVPSLGGAMLFLPVGLFLFEGVSIDWLIRGTGLAVLAMTLFGLKKPKPRAEPAQSQTLECFTAGAVGGFLAGAVSIAGPPIAAFALKQNWSPPRFKAFVNQFLFVVAVSKVAGLGLRGFLSANIGLQAICLAAPALLGIAIGARISRRLSGPRFKRLVAAALVAIALNFLVRGASN